MSPSDRGALLGTYRPSSERYLCDLVGRSCAQYGSGRTRRYNPLRHGLPALVVGGPATRATQSRDADPNDGRGSRVAEIGETGESEQSFRGLHRTLRQRRCLTISMSESSHSKRAFKLPFAAHTLSGDAKAAERLGRAHEPTAGRMTEE